MRAPLAGTTLAASPAPDFTLQDGVTGRSLSLGSLRGKVVVLTFLYTQCPDSCPLTAQLLRTARERVGADGSRVTIVAVSTDPARDTPEAIRAFSAVHRLQADWHYLIGRREQLQPVWTAFGVRAESEPGRPVEHSDAIYLIDARGRERALFHTDEKLETVVESLRTLLAEK